jgi:glycerophosphoryl diester phosphodiesterase
MREIKVIAHRGASALAPENSRAAFDLAVEQGSDAIELDVQQTSDGELVVWHDDSLDRTARLDGVRATGDLGARTFDEIALCDIGSWFNDGNASGAAAEYVGLCPLRLEDVLEEYGGRVQLFIELKRPERSPGMVQRAVELVPQHQRFDRPHHILSTDAGSLISIHCTAPTIPLLQVLPHQGQWPLTLKEVAGYAAGVSPLRSMVGPNFVSSAAAHGLTVYPHTVNNRSEIERLVDYGVDGIITDDPRLLRRSLAGAPTLHPATPQTLTSVWRG